MTSHHDLEMVGTASIWIEVTPSVVFAAVTDLTRMGEWSPENTGGEWIEGRPGAVGSRFRGRNRTAHGAWETELTVTECVSNEAFAFRVAPPGADGTEWRYTFECERGGTRVTERFHWRWTQIPDEGFRGRIGRMPLSEAHEQVSHRQVHLQQSAEATLVALKRKLEHDTRAETTNPATS